MQHPLNLPCSQPLTGRLFVESVSIHVASTRHKNLAALSEGLFINITNIGVALRGADVEGGDGEEDRVLEDDGADGDGEEERHAGAPVDPADGAGVDGTVRVHPRTRGQVVHQVGQGHWDGEERQSARC